MRLISKYKQEERKKITIVYERKKRERIEMRKSCISRSFGVYEEKRRSVQG